MMFLLHVYGEKVAEGRMRGAVGDVGERSRMTAPPPHKALYVVLFDDWRVACV
jgi:hypothetical protein